MVKVAHISQDVLLGDALVLLRNIRYEKYKNPVAITDPPWNVDRNYPTFVDRISEYENWINLWFDLLPPRKIIFPGLNHWEKYVKYNPTSLGFWYKRNGHSRAGNFQWAQGDPVLIWNVNFSQGNVFDIPVRNGWLKDKALSDHPNPQPVNLIKLIIGRMRNKPDLIIDPFCGTGTTIRAALDFNIPAVGFEIDPRSHEIAISRLHQRALALN